MSRLVSGAVLRAVAVAGVLSSAGVFAAPPPAAGPACAGSGEPSLELRIVPGALRGRSDEQIILRGFDDGCIAVQRPWFLRDAGTFERRLDGSAWKTLQRGLALDRLRGVDQQRLQAEVAATAKRQGADDTAVEYFEPDADLYVLRWRDGTLTRSLALHDLPGAAARQPNSAALSALSGAVETLRPLIERPAATQGNGGTR